MSREWLLFVSRRLCENHWISSATPVCVQPLAMGAGLVRQSAKLPGLFTHTQHDKEIQIRLGIAHVVVF